MYKYLLKVRCQNRFSGKHLFAAAASLFHQITQYTRTSMPTLDTYFRRDIFMYLLNFYTAPPKRVCLSVLVIFVCSLSSSTWDRPTVCLGLTNCWSLCRGLHGVTMRSLMVKIGSVSYKWPLCMTLKIRRVRYVSLWSSNYQHKAHLARLGKMWLGNGLC